MNKLIRDNIINIKSKKCHLIKSAQADICIIDIVSRFDEEYTLDIVDRIKATVPGILFDFAAICIAEPNMELSPWKEPAVFGTEAFGEGAGNTLKFICDEVIPYINSITASHQYILGGYSLAGLFALWASYQTNVFAGVAAVSPSVWFENWDKYISDNLVKTDCVYLSLGCKEHKTRNQKLKRVNDRINEQYNTIYKKQSNVKCVLEWNEGNHFTEPQVRKAKGYSWLLKNMGEMNVQE